MGWGGNNLKVESRVNFHAQRAKGPWCRISFLQCVSDLASHLSGGPPVPRHPWIGGLRIVASGNGKDKLYHQTLLGWEMVWAEMLSTAISCQAAPPLLPFYRAGNRCRSCTKILPCHERPRSPLLCLAHNQQARLATKLP